MPPVLVATLTMPLFGSYLVHEPSFTSTVVHGVTPGSVLSEVFPKFWVRTIGPGTRERLLIITPHR